MQQRLHGCRKNVYRIEYRGHIHQQHRKHIVEIFDIPEKDIKRRKNKSHAEVEYQQTHHWIQQSNEFPRKINIISDAEDEKNTHIDRKIYQR